MATRNKYQYAVLVAIVFLASFMWKRNVFQNSIRIILQNSTCPVKDAPALPKLDVKNVEDAPSELQVKINDIFDKIKNRFPNAGFSNFSSTTSGQKSKAFIAYPKDKYCVGEDFVVELEMQDHTGIKKAYGGDFLMPRIFSPELGASVSGRVEDFSNGTYHVHFPLYWEGKVKVSVMLFHPSEGISALWRARHASLGVLGFHGRFVYHNQEAITKCGFKPSTDEEYCEYLDPDDEEAFYCVKPSNLPCECLHDMRAVDIQASYLTNEEKQMFQRSNIAVEIPKNFEFIEVTRCKHETSQKTKCQTGMSSPLPSGYFLNNTWNPVYCKMDVYKTKEDFTRCLQGKKLFLIGDSTLRQFIMHFTEGISIVQYFGYHGRQWNYWEKTLLALSIDKDIYVSYKRHGFPLESFMFYYFKEDKYTSRQIDLQGGGKDTIIVITMGQHFRQFPLQLYIRRALNIRRAIERLFLRSPDTKVIIKTENTRELNTAVERIGDFNGYAQYLVLREVFQGVNVGFVDAWDMTISSAAQSVHPAGGTFESIMSMTFTFAC
ncbi:NXPE family member 4-like [Spea bombifrons]|uniref:NXPE family member 4-like n=1 Tax=Spea bombifrons TaxID=233779 RepID=UPI00234A17C3|nr:NXPE family member 4-like [Spea bombifrons]